MQVNLEDLERGIQYLENSVELDKIELEELHQIIIEKLKIIPFEQHIIPAGTKVFRARKNFELKPFFDKYVVDTSNPIIINNIAQISNRKDVHNITEFGRANKPGVSIFYSSTRPKMACAEVLKDVMNCIAPDRQCLFVTVGEWITVKDIILAPLIHSESVKKIRKDISNYIELKHNRHGRISNSESEKAYFSLLKFFSEQFSKKNISSHHDYKISAYYGDFVSKFSYNGLVFDGIIYPSVVSNYLGDNICLFDRDLESKIEFKNAYEIFCANIDFNADPPKIGACVESEMENLQENGEFTWRDINHNTTNTKTS